MFGKRSSTIVALGLVVGGLVIYFTQTERKTMPTILNVGGVNDDATKFPHWSKVHLKISGFNKVEHGKPHEVEVVLENGDEHWGMMVHRGNELSELGLTLFGTDGELPRSVRGQKLLRPTQEGYSAGGPMVPTGPGKSLTWKVDLADCFDLSPGTYKLIAATDVWAHDSENSARFSAALRRGAQIDGREIVSDPWTFVVK